MSSLNFFSLIEELEKVKDAWVGWLQLLEKILGRFSRLLSNFEFAITILPDIALLALLVLQYCIDKLEDS